MLIVQKYGGTSLAGMSRLRAAARRVTGLARQGNQVVVVVSAQGDTTDILLEKAETLHGLSQPPGKRPAAQRRRTDQRGAAGYGAVPSGDSCPEPYRLAGGHPYHGDIR